MKRTKKEQKADALLAAACAWQTSRTTDRCGVFWGDAWTLVCDEESDANNPQPWGDLLASSALSEVAGMGFDLLNADGSPCEKVAEMLTVGIRIDKRDDGTKYFVDKLQPVRR